MEKLDGIAHRIPTGVYKLLLVVATVIWGLSFVVMKDAVDVLQPAYLIGFRFLATGAILAALFFRRLRAALSGERALDYLVKGTILGVVCYLAFWVQTIGLDHTTPGKNAFLTATYCVIVPFAWWAIARKRPTAFNLVAAVMAVGGIGLMSLTGSLSELTMGFGDTMTLVSALLFAVLFSVLLYGEEIGLRLVGGFALIFVAIVVSETFPLKSKAGDDAPALALETPGGPVVSPEPLGVLCARDADGRAAVESMQEEASWSKSGTT
ncbi:DMT family transporter [Gordonibacter urolithinfaciens]|uniref:DMT family transporter n=1 Tax=Gordonibacter urolithinfaciens TaxID=1335613 RepID=UPI00194DEE51|nr:DMT family transporter [Gordonibacter urolithinfaciens]